MAEIGSTIPDGEFYGAHLCNYKLNKSLFPPQLLITQELVLSLNVESVI